MGATLGLSACASTAPRGTPADLQVKLDDLKAFVGRDLDAAIARATAATDQGAPYRARCYVTLKKYLPAPGARPRRGGRSASRRRDRPR